MGMGTALLLFTFILAFADWTATERRWVKVRYFTKPAVILALIVWFTVANSWHRFDVWFLLALILSLLGDINLMLPARFFLAGLVAFLAAHILYIVGFNLIPLNVAPLALVIVILVAILAVRIFAIIRTGLIRTSDGRKMLIPVSVYTLAISLMLISAWLCLFRPAWPVETAILAGVGALFFFTSDSLLAYTRYVGKIPHSDLLVMATYHLGQIAIIAGVIMLP